MIRCSSEMNEIFIKKSWIDGDGYDECSSFYVYTDGCWKNEVYSDEICQDPIPGEYSEVLLPHDYFHNLPIRINYHWKQHCLPERRKYDLVASSKFKIMDDEDFKLNEDRILSYDRVVGNSRFGHVRNSSTEFSYKKFTAHDSLEIIVRERIFLIDRTFSVYWRIPRQHFDLIPDEMKGDL